MSSPPTTSSLSTTSPVIHFLSSTCIFSLILPSVFQFFRVRAVLVSLPTPAVASAFVASLPTHSPQPHATSCHGDVEAPGEVTVRHGRVLSSLWSGTDESLLLSHGHFFCVTLETAISQFLWETFGDNNVCFSNVWVYLTALMCCMDATELINHHWLLWFHSAPWKTQRKEQCCRCWLYGNGSFLSG